VRPSQDWTAGSLNSDESDESDDNFTGDALSDSSLSQISVRREKSHTPPSKSSDESQEDPSRRRNKRPRRKSPSKSDSSEDENASQTLPSELSPNEFQEDEILSEPHGKDFPTPVSHQTPDDADDEETIIKVSVQHFTPTSYLIHYFQRQTDEAQRVYEEEKRQFQKGRAVERFLVRRLQIDKKQKALRVN
jgi:hypothetical protein